jgi:hypothetical protein
MTTVNNDQQLGLVLAPGSPNVNVDQELAVILAGAFPAKVNVDQQLAIVLANSTPTTKVFIDQQLAIIVEQRLTPQNCFQTVITGTFTDANNAPLSNGTVTFQLNHSAVSCAGQITTQIISITLDNTGSIPANTSIWSTGALSTSIDTLYYTMKVYRSNGQLVSQEELKIPKMTTFPLT